MGNSTFDCFDFVIHSMIIDSKDFFFWEGGEGRFIEITNLMHKFRWWIEFNKKLFVKWIISYFNIKQRIPFNKNI